MSLVNTGLGEKSWDHNVILFMGLRKWTEKIYLVGFSFSQYNESINAILLMRL